jgi:hypothetical protein
MKKTKPDEARNAIESVTTPFHIGFFFLAVLISAGCALYGLFAGISTEAWRSASIDPNVIFLCVGVIGFLFSFPTMVSLYVARMVLSRLRELEKELVRK